MSESSKNSGSFAISELREFAGFPAQTQRYIRCSLDIALTRRDAVSQWSRNGTESAAVKAQTRLYAILEDIRKIIPVSFDFEAIQPFMGKLVSVSAFDLGQDKLPSFSSYRFLYERLLGAPVRQWLPGAFCAAASLPHLHPNKRKDLLQSISEAAATAPGWSPREPSFFPEWVEKVE